jgi:thiamine biosynthesis lipoprotein ApbE
MHTASRTRVDLAGIGPAGASWPALGTSVVLRVCEASALPAALATVTRELAAIDAACSRFRVDSEISRVNAHAGRAMTVGPLLLEALEVALRAAECSDGDVDPTVGRALELAGYDRDWRLLEPAAGQPELSAKIAARIRSGWQAISLDRENASVRVPAGVKLDLGASAKAWAADRAASAAARDVGCGVLVSLGGDVATAGGAPAGGWRIRVTDDHRSDRSAPGQTISIHSGGLATSSTTVRRWSHGGHTMHHIIDPDTGAPVRETWRTVSVAAATCTDANTAATASLIRAGAAPAWLEALDLPARLVDTAGNATTVARWPLDLDAGAPAA